MNENVLLALATYSKINIVEAYTGKQLGMAALSVNGSLDIPTAGLIKLRADRIEEVRFRMDEMPEVFYRTDASVVFMKRKRESIARQLSLVSTN